MIIFSSLSNEKTYIWRQHTRHTISPTEVAKYCVLKVDISGGIDNFEVLENKSKDHVTGSFGRRDTSHSWIAFSYQLFCNPFISSRVYLTSRLFYFYNFFYRQILIVSILSTGKVEPTTSLILPSSPSNQPYSNQMLLERVETTTSLTLPSDFYH